jgi:hypothetical protein
MYWNAEAKSRFVSHLGKFVESKAQLPYHRALYFALPNLTVLLDDNRGVAMVLREGRGSH